jgi:hypothetical protein
MLPVRLANLIKWKIPEKIRKTSNIKNFTEGENRRAPAAPNLLGRHLAYQTGEHQASHGIPPATAGINQHSPLGRLTIPKNKTKQNRNLNNKQRTEN